MTTRRGFLSALVAVIAAPTSPLAAASHTYSPGTPIWIGVDHGGVEMTAIRRIWCNDGLIYYVDDEIPLPAWLHSEQPR